MTLLGLLLALSPVDLAWETAAPDGCDADAFHGYVAELVPDHEVSPAGPLPVTVRLHAREDGTWAIDLRLGQEDESAVRHFESASCHEVLEAAALVVAMELDPDFLGPTDEPEPEAELTEEAPVEPEGPVFSGPERVPPPHFGLRAYGGIIGLALPGWTGTIGGDAFFEGRAWRVAAGARYRFATTAELEGRGGGEFSYLAGRVTGCGIVRGQRFDYPLCGALEAGQIRAVGTGVDAPLTSRRPWISLRALPGISYGVADWLVLGLELDLGYVISQERYFLRDIGTLYELGAFEFGANLSVQFRFFRRRR